MPMAFSALFDNVQNPFLRSETDHGAARPAPWQPKEICQSMARAHDRRIIRQWPKASIMQAKTLIIFLAH
jgi:hypothetical protein